MCVLLRLDEIDSWIVCIKFRHYKRKRSVIYFPLNKSIFFTVLNPAVLISFWSIFQMFKSVAANLLQPFFALTFRFCERHRNTSTLIEAMDRTSATIFYSVVGWLESSVITRGTPDDGHKATAVIRPFVVWFAGVGAVPASPFYTSEHVSHGTRLIRFCFAKNDAVLELAMSKLLANKHLFVTSNKKS